MTAGYETTSTALAYATYVLAKHPEVLQKLQTEIDQLPLNDDDTSDEETKKYPDYDVVAQMSYMDMFVSEVLRMYPIGNGGVQRLASEDTVVQGIKIEKGKRYTFMLRVVSSFLNHHKIYKICIIICRVCFVESFFICILNKNFY